MIPIIGIMGGMYMMTRMVQLLGDHGSNNAAKFFGIMTMIVCVIGMLLLFTSSK